MVIIISPVKRIFELQLRMLLQTMTVFVQDSGPGPAHWHLISYHTSNDIKSGKLKVSQMDIHSRPTHHRLL